MIYALLFFIFFGDPVFEGWETLNKIKVELQFDEILNDSFEVPVFSDELKAFDGQEVSIEGYVIPLDATGEQDYFVLSQFPYNSCFFCGNAGPETVAEVYTKEKIDVRDQKVRVTAKLRLNSQNPLHLFFILEDAEVEKL